MTERYYLADGGHVLISGSTGARDDYGGKTVTANWWFSQLVERGWRDAGVYINPKGHGNIRGQRVSTLKGLAESWRSGNRLFNFHGDAPDGVVGTLRNLPGEKVVVFDEAQQYRDSEQLDWVLSQGGNLDSGSIRGLVVTQRPWNLSEELRANMPLKVWVGPVTPEARKFFQVEQMEGEIEKVRDEMEPYHWAVTDAGTFQHVNPPVPEDYA
jgi:hypothetical protein